MIPLYQGIDVSNLDDNLNWADIFLKVQPDFILLEIGKNTNHELKINNHFWQDYNWLKQHDVLLGCFWTSESNCDEDVKDEIKLISSLLKTQDFSFDFPIYYKQNTNFCDDKFVQTERIKKILNHFNNSGVPMGLGCSFEQLNNKLNYASLIDYSLWISQEDTSCTSVLPYDLWQYEKEIVPNINLNYCYKTLN